jgi:hypothetical protein
LAVKKTIAYYNTNAVVANATEINGIPLNYVCGSPNEKMPNKKKAEKPNNVNILNEKMPKVDISKRKRT